MELADGSRLEVRPIAPADRALLADGFDRLSPESRYRRFFSPVRRLSERQLDYLTDVDHSDHEALVAIDPDSGELIAVARYVRAVPPDVAEPAIAVVDDWQGRGVAGRLLDLLADRARDEGVESFVAPVLADNVAAIGLFERLGDTTMRRQGNEVELTIPLGARRGATPSLRSVLRAVAGGTAVPALAFWQRMTTSGAPPRAQRNAVVVGLPTEEAGPGATAVADAAGALAAGWGAEVHVVAARRFLLDDGGELAERLAGVASRLSAHDVAVETHVRRGDLGASLVDEAVQRGARLIVVDGSEPHASPPLLGSVWDHVTHHAPCDVLVAR